MFEEIAEVKRELAKRFNLPFEGSGPTARVLGVIPDGTYEMKLGGRIPVVVEMRDNLITIKAGNT